MPNQILNEAYSPSDFQKFGHELIDLLTGYLKQAQNQQSQVNNWIEPKDQLNFWEDYKMDQQSPTAFFKDILDRSMNVQHPKYIGHQIAPPAPLSALASLLSSLLNNGMAVYEMGPAATAIEKIVCKAITDKIGFDDKADGFLTSGGTLANLTALLSARQAMVDSDIWQNGLEKKLAVMVSSEAHYCVDRALRIMGFGAKGIIKVPVGKDYSMQTDQMETYYNNAVAVGLKVIAVVGSAPSTSTGIYDDLEAIASFCANKKLWFHVDAAHGGAAIFSEKYKLYLKGSERADSVVIDGHKMLMTPSVMTFLLFKNKNHSYATFSQKAQYLWESAEEEEWYNPAKRTFECTKSMMSIQFYVLLKFYGEALFDAFVTDLYDLGNSFASKVEARANFEIALPPHSNIVCFRYVEPGKTESELNDLNALIRRRLLTENEFYIVQTILKDRTYLRVTVMNPKTDLVVFDALLDRIERLSIK